MAWSQLIFKNQPSFLLLGISPIFLHFDVFSLYCCAQITAIFSWHDIIIWYLRSDIVTEYLKKYIRCLDKGLKKFLGIKKWGTFLWIFCVIRKSRECIDCSATGCILYPKHVFYQLGKTIFLSLIKTYVVFMDPFACT